MVQRPISRADSSDVREPVDKKNKVLGNDASSLELDSISAFLSRTSAFDPFEFEAGRFLEVARNLCESGSTFDAADYLRSFIIRTAIDQGIEKETVVSMRGRINRLTARLVAAQIDNPTTLVTDGLGLEIISIFVEEIKNNIEFYREIVHNLSDLTALFYKKLKTKLTDCGLSAAEAAGLSGHISSKFSSLSSIQSEHDVEIAVDAVLAAFSAIQSSDNPRMSFPKRHLAEFSAADGSLSGSLPREDGGLSAWELARRTKLPERAVPFAEGKQAGESVLDYYQRFWGPYRDAGVLYQDDIARLGDDQMVKKVRTACTRQHLDPADILPPPRKQRTEDELAAVPSDSRDAALLELRIAQRDAVARSRIKRAKAFPK